MVYNLFPTLYHAMQNGGVAVIDELDNAIHSLLVPEIVDLFVDAERNPHRGASPSKHIAILTDSALGELGNIYATAGAGAKIALIKRGEGKSPRRAPVRAGYARGS